MYSVCIYIYTLLKLVGYYDLSVLYMSVMVSKKFGWCLRLIFFFWIFGIFLTLQSPLGGQGDIIKLCHMPAFI